MADLAEIRNDIAATKIKLAQAEDNGDREFILMYGKTLAEQQKKENLLLGAQLGALAPAPVAPQELQAIRIVIHYKKAELVVSVFSLEQLFSDILAHWEPLVFCRFVVKFGKEVIKSDEDLNALLENSIISVEILQKGFSDISEAESLSYAKVNYGDIGLIPIGTTEFADCQLDINAEVDVVVGELLRRIRVYDTNGASECTMREFIGPVLIGALTVIAGADGVSSIKLIAEKPITGEFGKGPVDYSMEYRNFDIMLTEVKREHMNSGIIQNISQQVASREHFARKCTPATGDEKKRKYLEALDEMLPIPSCGIVTCGESWVFILYIHDTNGWNLVQSDTYVLNLRLPANQATLAAQVCTILSKIVNLLASQVEAIDRLPIWERLKRS